MLTLYNFTTRESRPIAAPIPISSEELLLTAGESLTDLINLHAAWLKDIPGQSHLILTLRHDLIRADWHRRRARTILQQFQLDLYLTGLPMQYWDPFIQKQIRFLEKHAAHTQNEFRKALQLIQSQKPATAKPEDPPTPPKPQRDYSPNWMQTVKVSIVDGKTVTEYEPKQEDFLKPEILSLFGRAWRSYYFCNGIPEEYAWVTQHRGIDHGPTKSISICHSMETFKEICEREIQTSAEHLLDGPRIGYEHRPDLPPTKFPGSP